MNSSFWRGKRVLITGHTGFKGSWLSLWLQSMGVEVIGYALEPTTQPNMFESAQVCRGITSLIGDVCDRQSLEAVVAKHRPQLLFHMAAQSLVRESYNDPAGTYATNVLGTVHLFEAVRQSPGVRVVVNVTSDKCYENREWLWGYRENDAVGGYDPYSSSKGCAELVTAAYRRSYFNPLKYSEHGVGLASARAGNVVGGGDWAEDRLIPDTMRAIIRGEPAVIRNPDAIRPWQHVLDLLSGYLLLAERLWCDGPAYAEAWNFGPRDAEPRPVRWVVERLTGKWGKDAHWTPDTANHPHEAHHLKLDCAKSQQRLGWRSRWPLDYSLERVVEWYKQHARGGDLRAVTLQQIRAYQVLGAGQPDTPLRQDRASR